MTKENQTIDEKIKNIQNLVQEELRKINFKFIQTLDAQFVELSSLRNKSNQIFFKINFKELFPTLEEMGITDDLPSKEWRELYYGNRIPFVENRKKEVEENVVIPLGKKIKSLYKIPVHIEISGVTKMAISKQEETHYTTLFKI